MDKIWQVKGKFSGDLLSDLLTVRNLDKQSFLNPQHPTKIIESLDLDFDSAVQLIKSHIAKGSPITIHGDYDVDGICATAILWKTIYFDMGYKNCLPFVPNRFEDGYGLTVGSVAKIKEKSGGGLIITVDCGITATKACGHAKGLGFDVIITDHHQKPAELPKPDVLLWTDELVGSGIALALSSHLLAFNEEYLSLAALATVTDISPLVSHNRSIVKFGLENLNSKTPLGVKSLLDVAGAYGKGVGTYELGWIIGPRLNASGRLDSAMNSLRLLCTKSEAEARDLAFKLNVSNRERQDKTFELVERAKTQDFAGTKLIAIAGENYHEGVIGLVASKLTQEFYRPSIVISLGGEVSKGSARSVEGVDILSLLRKLDLYDELGGHKMAAGFGIKTNLVEKFIEEIQKLSEEFIDNESLQKKLVVDLELPVEVLKMSVLDDIKQLEPFGFGNPEPVFVTKGLKIVDSRVVGSKGNHVKLGLFHEGSNSRLNGIFFGGARKVSDLTSDRVDLAFSLKENTYGGGSTLELQVKDIDTTLTL